MLRGMTATLRAHGAPASEALRQAYGLLQGNLQRQATMLAYVDNFWILGPIATLFLMPCVFLIKKPPGATVPCTRTNGLARAKSSGSEDGHWIDPSRQPTLRFDRLVVVHALDLEAE